MSRVLAYGFGLGLIAAVVSPAFGTPQADSYPLSTYPMFSQKRRAPILYFAEGVTAGGRRVRLPPNLVANAEVMQAVAAVKRAVLGGEEMSEQLCRAAARRVRASPAHTEVVRVELVGARFDPVGYFVKGDEPEERTVHHLCPVRGDP
jgi:hypothetical protein